MTDTKPRILVVDDELDLVSVLRMGLEIQGFEVIEAMDGEEGLRRARQDLPDLVVLDLMLPKLDGYKVCRALKFDERFRNLPIIILSARSGEQDRRLALDMGAALFMTKPYEIAELVTKIRLKLEEAAKRAA
ncbi:MAG: response regulator [Candidatus Eisenbacteria bacterium]